jgi:MerR family transcriptional regulator, copper efflux regulator
MLISEFSKATGLSPDTVRFYIRRGLLDPETGSKGGRNPYQIFTEEHVRTARLIRMAQSLGMSLKEISAIGEEHRKGLITRERSIELMEIQLARLDAKRAELEAMGDYLRAKLAWLHAGEPGPEPEFSAFVPGAADGRCD